MTIAPAGTAARGRQCPCRAFELVAGAEHRVEDAIELALPDVSAQPARPIAAERDDPRAITVSQRCLHYLSRAPHDSFGGLRRRARGLPIGVDQHHHVSRSVGQPLRHVQLTAAGAHRPVHRPQLVARDVGANVGVLDTRADVPGEMSPEAVQQFGLRDGRRLRRRQREHDHLCGVDRGRSGQQPTARRHVDTGPDGVSAPPLGNSRNTFDLNRRLIRFRIGAFELHPIDGFHRELHRRPGGDGAGRAL